MLTKEKSLGKKIS